MLLGSCGGVRTKDQALVEIAPSDAGASAPTQKADSRLPTRPVGAVESAAPIAWETSERDARDRARRRRRPLIVYLRADWSSAALELDRGVWSDPRVIRAARGFVALKLDLTAAEGDAELYAQHYGVRSVPTTVVFDATGRRVGALGGPFTADDLLPLLSRADEDAPAP